MTTTDLPPVPDSWLDVATLTSQVERLIRTGDTRKLKEVRELLKAAVDHKQALGRKERWMNDPAAWVRERLGQEVWSKQKEILESVRDNRRTAVRSGHGVGKSHTAALTACWWIDSHEPGTAFVISTAPTSAQIRAILWRYINRMHKAGKLPGRTNQTEWWLDDAMVGFGRRPADRDESGLQGLHERYVLVLYDEACGIPEQIWTAGDALATGPDCRQLAIGNPDNSASKFYEVCLPGSAWNKLKISAFDSPNFTGEPVSEAVAASLVSKIWVEEKEADWGTDNPLYMSKVLGEFSLDSHDMVVRATDVAACRLEKETEFTTYELLPVELGVDVGGGQDETVIRERRGMRAGREWKIRTDRPEKIAPLVTHAIRESGATAVKVDSIGVGFGVIGELRNAASRGEHSARIIGVNVANASAEPAKYVNLRAELWWKIGRDYSAARMWDLSGMDNPDDTCAQLLQPRWSLDVKGRILVEKKEDIIKRNGRSPDNADSLLLAYFSGLKPRIRILQ